MGTILPNGGRDGRDARWEAHRTKRRRQLVEAALRAIRKHGAGVGMDDIAAEAATSKTVLYRHLGDKLGLYRAVVAAVDETILADLSAAHATGADVVSRISAMASSYLGMVQRDPEIYRFVMTRPLQTVEGHPDDPVHQLTDRVAQQLTETLQKHLESAGHPQAELLAPVWGYGIVGLVQSAADHWLTQQSRPSAPTIEQVTDALVALISPGLQSGTPPADPPQPSRHTGSDNHEDAS